MNNNHLQKVRALFSRVGLTLHRFDYYSPDSYNYQGDSMDLEMSISDKDKLKRFILSEKSNIKKALDSNKSYDGYIATTKNNIQEVFEEIDNQSEVDSMVVSYILSKYPLDIYDDYFEVVVREDDEDDE